MRSLNPGGAAEKSGGLKVGDLITAVNGKDVTALTDADVANLCKGAPGAPLTLSLCPKTEASLHEKLHEPARNRNDSESKAQQQPDALSRGRTLSSSTDSSSVRLGSAVSASRISSRSTSGTSDTAYLHLSILQSLDKLSGKQGEEQFERTQSPRGLDDSVDSGRVDLAQKALSDKASELTRYGEISTSCSAQKGREASMLTCLHRPSTTADRIRDPNPTCAKYAQHHVCGGQCDGGGSRGELVKA